MQREGRIASQKGRGRAGPNYTVSRARPVGNVHCEVLRTEHKVCQPGESKGDNVRADNNNSCKAQQLPHAPETLEVAAAEGNGDKRDEELAKVRPSCKQPASECSLR